MNNKNYLNHNKGLNGENQRKNVSDGGGGRGHMRGFGGPMLGGGKPKNFAQSIAKLLKYIKAYLPIIISSLIFSSGAVVLSILAPSKLGDMTNLITRGAMIGNVDLNAVSSIGITLVIFHISSLILNYTSNFLMAGVNQKLAKNLRTDISKKINLVPLKYYDKNSFGDVLSRVTNDVDTIGQSLNQSVSILFTSVIMFVGVLIAMFVNCWQLALTTIAIIPISIIFMTFIMRFSQKYFMAQQRELGAINGLIEENYSGQIVVKAFNGEEKSLNEFSKTNQMLYKSAKKSQFLSGLMYPIIHLISNIGYVAICVVGTILLTKGYIDIGVMASFFIYVHLFQRPVLDLSQTLTVLQSTVAASERVFEFLDETEQSRENPDSLVKLEKIDGNVEFKNVRFGYDENKTVINNFSAFVKAGQKVAVVGPTGAGKTTIINLLMRFYEINFGEILIDNVSINRMSREDVRAMFSMVLQDTWLFEGSIKENIIYSKKGVTDEEVINACKASNVDHFIRTLPNGYDMHLDDDVNISSGQKQLLTIARAMVQNSPMLILDEATSNVDTRTEQLIQDAMDKIMKNRTCFVIAHRLSTIKNADLILVLKDGDIIESGNHDELMNKNGFYCELYNSQFTES